MCAQHVGVGAGVHFLSALFGSLPRCLFTVALGGDIAAAAMAPSIDQLPTSSVARLVVGALSLLAPIALRQYCQKQAVQHYWHTRESVYERSLHPFSHSAEMK